MSLVDGQGVSAAITSSRACGPCRSSASSSAILRLPSTKDRSGCRSARRRSMPIADSVCPWSSVHRTWTVSVPRTLAPWSRSDWPEGQGSSAGCLPWKARAVAMGVLRRTVELPECDRFHVSTIICCELRGVVGGVGWACDRAAAAGAGRLWSRWLLYFAAVPHGIRVLTSAEESPPQRRERRTIRRACAPCADHPARPRYRLVSSTRGSRDGRYVTTVRDRSEAWMHRW